MEVLRCGLAGWLTSLVFLLSYSTFLLLSFLAFCVLCFVLWTIVRLSEKLVYSIVLSYMLVYHDGNSVSLPRTI